MIWDFPPPGEDPEKPAEMKQLVNVGLAFAFLFGRILLALQPLRWNRTASAWSRSWLRPRSRSRRTTRAGGLCSASYWVSVMRAWSGTISARGRRTEVGHRRLISRSGQVSAVGSHHGGSQAGFQGEIEPLQPHSTQALTGAPCQAPGWGRFCWDITAHLFVSEAVGMTTKNKGLSPVSWCCCIGHVKPHMR